MSLSSRLNVLGLAAALLAGPISLSHAVNAAPAAASHLPVDAGVKPWPAPTGHRQPHVGDVPLQAKSNADLGEDWLDAELDRKLRICRGC